MADSGFEGGGNWFPLTEILQLQRKQCSATFLVVCPSIVPIDLRGRGRKKLSKIIVHKN
jgi:hypothetical protein